MSRVGPSGSITPFRSLALIAQLLEPCSGAFGILLTAGPFDDVSGDASGGIFLLSFPAGWFLIPVLSTIFTGDNHWWALIPGGIMAVIGGALLFGGMAIAVLEFLGQIWPVFLILGGLYLILRRSGKNAT